METEKVYFRTGRPFCQDALPLNLKNNLFFTSLLIPYEKKFYLRYSLQ
jgi:hypothetical protein